MNKLATFLLALFGLHCGTACSQLTFQNTDVEGFIPITADPTVTILDVRTAEEFAEGHIAGAVNINVNDSSFLKTAISKLEKEKTIAVYCRSGRRSVDAANQLTREGFSVINLEGGILAWKTQGQPVTTDTHERDVFLTPSGKAVEIYALMHASIRIVYEGREIYVDPVEHLGNQHVDYTILPKADYVLVTHEHGDHFNPQTIQGLLKPDSQFLTNQRCADKLGFQHPGTVVLANGENAVLEHGITLETVPAYNITEGHLQFHPRGRDNGFILTIDGLRIYIAGDTEDIPEMAELAPSEKQPAIDIAFLPCNQPYTMTTEQLLHAAKMVQPRVLFPYHYGQTDVSNVPAQLQDTSIEVRIRHYE